MSGRRGRSRQPKGIGPGLPVVDRPQAIIAQNLADITGAS